MLGQTKSFQRNTNLAIVLQTIRYNEAISRIEIAKQLGLNKSTITHIVTQLLQNKVIKVQSEGQVSSSGGRKPILLTLNGEFGCVLGMEIRFNRCRAVLLSMVGELLLDREIALDSVEGDFSEAFFSCFDSMQADIKKLGIPLIGIGLGVPANVDPHSGRIIRSYSLELDNYEFGARVASHLNYPVILDNDANCCAWGELYKSGTKGPDNFIYVLPKFKTREEEDYKGLNAVGIGIGVVINKQVYYGSNHAAGEFRSAFWTEPQKELVNIPSNELLQINTDKTVLREFAKELLVNLSVVSSVLDPGCIFIGGDLNDHFKVIEDILANELVHHYIANESSRCRVLAHAFDKNSVAEGAARMFLQRLFNIPSLKKSRSYITLSWDRIFSNSGWDDS
ncbi:hypothetical protein ES707_15256 [subsurface metagenome]